MSMRYQAGIVLPGYNPLKVANAPTIGTATNAGATSVSVAFTAPACVGGGAISSYTAFANCGVYTASGASSPLTVTGLTTGTAYTFKVIATNVFGPSYPSAASNSATPAVIQGQQAYTTAGTYSWVAPSGVTSISVVSVGGGGGGGASVTAGGGGGLGYKNNITVVPGNSYTVFVGPGGNPGQGGSASYFNANTSDNVNPVGRGGVSGGSATGGVFYGTGGGQGGQGGIYQGCIPLGAGGGGAGGYSGAGGAGGNDTGMAGSAGAGGGGGGGGFAYGSGGGVGILGQGANGAAGTSSGGGGGGSGGANGTVGAASVGGAYGGGGAGNSPNTPGTGGVGAVRIIWPGTTRSFPSTNTGDL